jgi:hypothetical protein
MVVYQFKLVHSSRKPGAQVQQQVTDQANPRLLQQAAGIRSPRRLHQHPPVAVIRTAAQLAAAAAAVVAAVMPVLAMQQAVETQAAVMTPAAGVAVRRGAGRAEREEVGGLIPGFIKPLRMHLQRHLLASGQVLVAVYQAAKKVAAAVKMTAVMTAAATLAARRAEGVCMALSRLVCVNVPELLIQRLFLLGCKGNEQLHAGIMWLSSTMGHETHLVFSTCMTHAP